MHAAKDVAVDKPAPSQKKVANFKLEIELMNWSLLRLLSQGYIATCPKVRPDVIETDTSFHKILNSASPNESLK